MKIIKRNLDSLTEIEQLGCLFQSILTSNYGLAHELSIEGYIGFTTEILKILANIKNIIILAIAGEKDAFYKVKEALENQIYALIEAHTQIVEENAKLNKEEMKAH